MIPHPYAFNVFSHNTAIDPETGYNDEETKVIKETRKIFEDEPIAHRRHLRARAGAARALRGHHLRMRTADLGGRGARDPGQCAGRARSSTTARENYFPMPMDASGQDDVLVGRIRKDLSDPSRPFDRDVRLGRPVAERCGAQRRADCGTVAATRDGVRRSEAIVGGQRRVGVVPTRSSALVALEE